MEPGKIVFLEYFAGKTLDLFINWVKIFIVNRIRRRDLSVNSQNIAYAFDVFSSGRIKPSQFVLKKIGRIERGEIGEIIGVWSGGVDDILLIGEAGSGKSGIAHCLGKTLQGSGNPILFIDVVEIPNTKDPISYLDHLLPLDMGLIEAFSILGEEKECYLIIDQLDSIVRSDSFLGFISLLKSVKTLQGVRILAVSRSFEAKEEESLKDLGFTQIQSHSLNKEDAAAHLNKLGIIAPSDFILELASNLLNLSLMAEIVDAKGDFYGLHSETDLWERYVKTISAREGEERLDLAFHLARNSMRETSPDFPIPLIGNYGYRRLLSRGILITHSFRRVRFRHEKLQEFLCAIQVFPQRPLAIDVYEEYGDIKGRRIIRWFLSLLHMHDADMEAQFIDDVLSREEELQFYSRSIALDVLREQKKPNLVTVESLIPHLTKEIYEKYFFLDLDNVSWAPLLHEAGYFMNPPPPIEFQSGSIRYPWWFGGEYLIRIAKHYPEIVVSAASSIQSQNGNVLDKLLEALLQIPPDFGARTIQNIVNWLPTLKGYFDPVKLSQFIGYLDENGYGLEALELLDAILTPIIPDSDRKSDRVRLRMVQAASVVEDYWLKEIWGLYGKSIIRSVPLKAAEILEKNLIQAFKLEEIIYDAQGGYKSSSFWRSAIEDHPQNISLHALKDILVDGIRDAVLEVCDQNATDGQGLIKKYISSDYSILVRISLHTLRYFGNQYPKLLNEVFSTRDVLDNSEAYHEIYNLLQLQFNNLTDVNRRRVIGWYFEGPSETEAISNWIIEKEGPEKHDEELKRYKDFWTYRRLWAIREYLEGEDLRRFEELSQKFNEPDHPDFLSWSTGVRSISFVSPMTKEELHSLSFEEIIREIKTYEPNTPAIEHSRKGFAETLGAAVSESPQHFTDLAHLFIDDEVRFVYTYYYLSGIKEGIDRSENLDLGPILELCEYTASKKDDPHEIDEDSYEAGLRTAQLEVANLVESALKKDPPYLDIEYIEFTKRIINLLLENSDPDPDSEVHSGWDPASQSLNCVRGQAMHDLFHLARYLDKQARNEKGEEEFRPEFDPYIRSKLEEKIDKRNDQSLSVHAVFGWQTPLLEYFDSRWLEEKLPHIFPEDPQEERYWLAAWDAYVSFNYVYKRPFLMLLTQYRRAISFLGESEDPYRFGTTKGERLAEHLIYAYVHQLIDLDSEDGLIKSFYENADDKVRGHVAFWLVKAFSELKLQLDDPIWQRMWQLMKWRISTASESGNVEDYQEEVSAYMRWLEHSPVGFIEMEPLLRQVVAFLKEGYNKKLVIEYLSKHCEQHPQEAIEILHDVIRRIEREWFTLYEEDAGKIIEAATQSGNEKAVNEAILLINLLGERGDFRWKKYLPDE
jgi:hypothetical protein